MKLLPLASLLALLAGGASAQDAAKEEPKKAGGLIDAAKRLIGDKDKISDETKKKAADATKGALEQMPDDLKNRAKELISGPKAAEARAQALDTVKAAVKSSPPSDGTVVAQAVPATAAVPAGPRPQPLQPLALDDPQAALKAQRGQTIITATKSAFFDAESGMGLYSGNVHARHPQMVIDCDELEIHMKKQPEGAAAKNKSVAAADTDILAGPGTKKKGGSLADSGIKIAYARGTMVTIEKRTEEGELQIAHCNDVATYDGSTGDITLRGMPSVQQGNKLIEASDPRTYMIIDQKGKLTVLGGQQRTTLIDEKAVETASPGAPVNEAPPVPPQR